jgi:hypothetical protein
MDEEKTVDSEIVATYPKYSPGIAKAAKLIEDNGIPLTYSSDGEAGSQFPDPIVAFRDMEVGAGWRALALCLTAGLPVKELRQSWHIVDRDRPTGPSWEITFTENMD